MIRVFIVDDSVIVRKRLTTMLSGLRGIELVGETGDPLEAAEVIGRLIPDVVILDIQMPRRSGIEVLQDLKRAVPAPIVVMLTNYPLQQYRHRCREAGAEFFFDKSAEFDKVPDVLLQLSRKLTVSTGEAGTVAKKGTAALGPRTR